MLTSMCWVPAGAMQAVPQRLGVKPKAEKEEEEDGEAWEKKEVDDDDKRNPGHVFDQGQGVLDAISSDDEDEVNDTTFRPTDLVFVATKTDEEQPSIELYVYDDPSDHIYLHHDCPLGGFPLCSSWLTDGQASLALIGTMLPFLEIWSLDIVDAVEPMAVLGGCTDPNDNYRRKVKKSRLRQDSHVDAIMSCDWNLGMQNVVATGSADKTVRIWDLVSLASTHQLPHGDKVQGVRWHPHFPSVLLTASFDGLVSHYDSRVGSAPTGQANLGTTPEKISWVTVPGGAPDSVTCVLASDSSGHLSLFDTRNMSAPVWRVQVADESANFSLNRHVGGLLATGGGKQGVIKLWDCRSGVPVQLSHRAFPIGELFALEFHPNSPYTLGGCGSAGQPLVYHVAGDAAAMVGTSQ